MPNYEVQPGFKIFHAMNEYTEGETIEMSETKAAIHGEALKEVGNSAIKSTAKKDAISSP